LDLADTAGEDDFTKDASEFSSPVLLGLDLSPDLGDNLDAAAFLVKEEV
jgi:hypothetical protein